LSAYVGTVHRQHEWNPLHQRVTTARSPGLPSAGTRSASRRTAQRRQRGCDEQERSFEDAPCCARSSA
jgi:hypothetical protein